VAFPLANRKVIYLPYLLDNPLHQANSFPAQSVKKLDNVTSLQSLQVLGQELREEVVELGDQLAVNVDDLQKRRVRT
jgi:hypothetical protein